MRLYSPGLDQSKREVYIIYMYISHKVGSLQTSAPFFFLDIDDCAGQPCLNGGTCIDRLNDYTCICAVGYHGKNCNSGKTVSFSETKSQNDITISSNAETVSCMMPEPTSCPVL